MQVVPSIDEIELELWLLAHESKRQALRLRMVMDVVYELALAQFQQLRQLD